MKVLDYKVGDIVEMKKPHPCTNRSKLFEVLRVGADVKVRCLGCNAILLISRDNFDKGFKSVKEHKE